MTNGRPVCIFTAMAADRPSPAALREMQGCVCFALRRTSRVVTQFYEAALRPHRLRATQFPILVAASEEQALPLAPLAESLGMDRTTLLRNVRPLVRRGLLDVVTPSGSRRTLVRATAAGRALLARVYPAWRRAQARALRSLEGVDWPGTLDALSRLPRSGAR